MSRSARNSFAARPTIIAVIGGINMDLMMTVLRAPDTGESMDARSLVHLPGGKGSNTAVAAHRASRPNPASVAANNTNSNLISSPTSGQRVTRSTTNDGSHLDIKICMNGAVGKDSYGDQLKAKLTDSGINIAGVHTINGVSSNLCVVLVEEDTGDSRNVGYPAANLHWALPPSGSLATLGDGTVPDLIVTSLVVPRTEVERVLEIAGKENIDTLLNPSSPEYLVSKVYRHLTHLVMNESETAMLFARPLEGLTGLAAYKEAGAHFVDMGVQNVVITLGSKGAFYMTKKGESGLVDAEKGVNVIDTTGAG
jgi:ribokinase